MSIVAIIPARGGSKRVPGKNKRLFAGKPLVAYACEAAAHSRAIGRALLSTDDSEIAAIGRECGVEAPFLRPAEIANDAAPMLPVLRHALDWLIADGEPVEALALLQPTSPLRTAAHVDEACRLFVDSGADTVVSVTPVPHQFHPAKLMGRRDGRFGALLDDAPPPGQSGALAEAYGRNGPAILITRATVLVEQGGLYGERIEPYVMAACVSVDIDTEEDFQLAELLFEAQAR